MGPFLDSDAYEFPSSAAAKQFVQSTARAVIGCHHMDETDPEDGSQIFQQRTLTATCAAGVVAHIEAAPDLPAGVLFRNTKRGVSPYRASMVIGSAVVHVNLCECVGVDDRIALVRSWAAAIAQQLAAPPVT
jgi:hypothetical protein